MSWTDRLDNLRASLPNFEERAEQTRLAQTIEKAFANGTHLEAQAGTGCIQGDALIAINRAGIGKQITLRDLVIRQSGARTPGQQRYWDLSIPTMVQREVDGVVRLAELKAAWFSGVKTTYTVTTDAGRTIRATDEHPFLTERGWLRLDELVVGDEVHVRGQQAAGAPRQEKPQYRTRSGLVGHPFAGRRDSALKHSFRYPTHRLVAEAALNGLELDDFLSRLRDSASHRELQFIDPEVYAVHHIDLDSLNNDLGNLKVLTHEEHHRLHAELGKTESVLYKIFTEKVVSVELYGEEETYDIEVVDDPHNFLANGFVVHNTGKSFACLIPAIEHAQATGRPVVIATETKALQAQYAHKDVPFLKEHLGIDFSAALLKGRSNYLCRQRLTEATEKEVLNIAQLREEVESTPEMTGDMEDLITDVGLDERRALTMSSEECPGKRECPFGDVCFAERAKERARSADVIIANHHLLATEVSLREETHSDEFPDGIGFLPEFSGLVIDEAHGFQDVATDLLGGKFAERQLLRFATDAATLLEDNKIPAPLERAAHTLFLTLTEWMDEQNRRNRTRDRSMELPHTVIERFFESFIVVTDEIAEVKRAVKRLDTYGNDRDEQRKKRMVKRADNLIKRMAGFVSASSDELVRWVELASTPRGDTLELHYAPLDVAPYLDEWLWNRHTTVLMSATLAVGNDFSFITQQLGLPSPTTFDAGTPFDYPNQAAFFCPQIECDPTSGAKWQARVAVAIDKLVGAADGRALILFTSRRELEAAWTSTHELIEDRGISVFKQVAGGNNRALGEEFKSNERSVLFALKSFMTGFDVQGSSLELVILNKLPFANPSDIILKARCDALDRQVEAQRKNKWVHGSFPKITVPTMTLVLLQAFGRLIRTRNDRGVVVLLDDRLYTKGYGSRIRKALPPAETLTRLVEAEDYLRDLRSVVG